MDWVFVGITILFFLVALFFGFAPESKYKTKDDPLGGIIACLGFFIYGGGGLIRKRILIGPGALLYKGFWAIIWSLLFLTLGSAGVYIFLKDYLL